MKKKWQKTGEGKYVFMINDTVAGSMNIAVNSGNQVAMVKTGNSEYIIKRTGFWKNRIEVNTPGGKTIAKVYAEKWYGRTMALGYGNERYKIVVRNNPLAEWAIMLNEQVLRAYGLKSEKGKVLVQITDNGNTDLLFDCLLWYLFSPVAAEHTGGDIGF